MGTLADRVRELNTALNAHDVSSIEKMYADAGDFDWNGIPPMASRQAVGQFYTTLFNAFPDIRARILRIVEGGNTVAVEYETSGTQTGSLPSSAGEIPATGRSVIVRGVAIASVDERGKIAMQHEYFNQVDILKQLGVLPGSSVVAEHAGSR